MSMAYTNPQPRQKLLQHLVFWLALYVYFAYIDSGYDHRYQRAFSNQGILLPLKVVLCYCILYYLLPSFLYRRRYYLFFSLLLVFVFLGAVGYRLIQGFILLQAFRPRLPFTPLDVGRFLWALFDVSFPTVIAISIKLMKSKYESAQREQQLQNENLRAELRFLKAQMSPHFLFNTLNNIYGLSLANSAMASEAILKLSGVLRFVLHNAASRDISLEEELEILDDYIALERLRYGDRLELKMEQQIDERGTRIAPLILLSLVENAFKHGASESLANPFIHISLKVEKELLQFNIRNSKEPRAAQTTQGIGLANIRRQLELTYGDLYSIDIRDEEFIYSLHLSIKLHEHEQAELHDH